MTICKLKLSSVPNPHPSKKVYGITKSSVQNPHPSEKKSMETLNLPSQTPIPPKKVYGITQSSVPNPHPSEKKRSMESLIQNNLHFVNGYSNNRGGKRKNTTLFNFAPQIWRNNRIYFILFHYIIIYM